MRLDPAPEHGPLLQAASSAGGSSASGSPAHRRPPASVALPPARSLQALDELWGDEAAADDEHAVLAEEVFMQHVTRVFKVNKRTWDFYARLAAQQAATATAAAADDAAAAAGEAESAPASHWLDPAEFRFRTTLEDVPAHLLPSGHLHTMSLGPQLGGGAGSHTLATWSRAPAEPPVGASIGPRSFGAATSDARGHAQPQQPHTAAAAAAARGKGLGASAAPAPANGRSAGPGSQQQQHQQQAAYRSRLRRGLLGLPVLSPEHRAAWLWSLLMLAMDAIYIAFLMPLFAAWCPVVLGGLNWCSSIDLASGLVFAVNLLVSFQIGFVLEHGHKKRLLMDGRHVARFYVLRAGFFIDVAAVLPVVYQIIMLIFHIENYWANRCMTFTMLLRLVRLVGLMKLLFVDSLITGGGGVSRHISVLGQYALVAAYAVAVLVHNLACLAWLVALMEGLDASWAASVRWSGGPGGLLDAAAPEQYLAALYWVFTTVTTTGSGDIVPTTPPEVFLALLFMATGVSMVALLIGSMTELLTQATSDARRAHAFRQKMTEVDEWLVRRSIPSKLSRAVINYYNQVWLPQRDHPTEAAILAELPPSLRGRVAGFITHELLAGVPVLAALSPAVREDLASRLEPVDLAPGHELCREGDVADCMWLLQEGELLRIRGTQLELLGPPCWLGESCLLADEVPALQYRPATLRAVSSCQLWQLSLRELHVLAYNHEGLGETLMAAARASAGERLLLSLGRGGSGGGAADFAVLGSRLQSAGGGGDADGGGGAGSGSRVWPLSARSMPAARVAAAAGQDGGTEQQQQQQWGGSGRERRVHYSESPPWAADRPLGAQSMPASLHAGGIGAAQHRLGSSSGGAGGRQGLMSSGSLRALRQGAPAQQQPQPQQQPLLLRPESGGGSLSLLVVPSSSPARSPAVFDGSPSPHGSAHSSSGLHGT